MFSMDFKTAGPMLIPFSGNSLIGLAGDPGTFGSARKNKFLFFKLYVFFVIIRATRAERGRIVS